MTSSRWLALCTFPFCTFPMFAAVLPSAWAAPAQGVAYVTNQGDGVSVIDLATLKIARTIQVGKDPRGLGITPDGRTLVTANQADEDISVVDAATGKTAHRITVGKNAEFVRVSPDGRFAYVTYEPSSTGKPPGKEEQASGKGDKAEQAEPAEIAVVDLSKFQVSARLPASLETEGMDFSLDQRNLIVANEGDDTVVVYDLATGHAIKKIDVSRFGKRPRGVKVSPDGSTVLVTLESSDNFLVLDSHYEPQKAVATGKGPYGVAFEPGGAAVWIAVARSEQIQVLDSSTFAPLASIPVGKRCWHFSFTPDGTKALVACGRSDALTVIDVATRQAVSTLTGFKQPWGIVTYPKSSGSLDTPGK
ncbi:MAG TPA: beta-propeller fold lactonase family protein [Burkholderiaceae bacterium]|nr:beta-propeller fold lactonase family protein [Burkholderiaceae bacterium]